MQVDFAIEWRGHRRLHYRVVELSERQPQDPSSGPPAPEQARGNPPILRMTAIEPLFPQDDILNFVLKKIRFLIRATTCAACGRGLAPQLRGPGPSSKAVCAFLPAVLSRPRRCCALRLWRREAA